VDRFLNPVKRTVDLFQLLMLALYAGSVAWKG